MTASILAMENHMPMYVFSLSEPDGIVKAAKGIVSGTKVTADA